MKYVFHFSDVDQYGNQTRALLAQLGELLEGLDHSYMLSCLDGDLTRYENNYFKSEAGEIHVVLLAGEKGLALADHFKSMEVPPLVIWQGGEPPQNLSELDVKQPDISLLPEWSLKQLTEELLQEKTQLIKLPTLINNFSKEALELSVDQVLSFREDKLDQPLPKLSDKTVLSVYLDGDIEQADGQLRLFTTAKAKQLAGSVVNYIDKNNLESDKLVIFIAPGLNTGLYNAQGKKLPNNPHEIGAIDDVTLSFMIELERQLKPKQLANLEIIGFPTTHGELEPGLAMLDMAVTAKKGICFIPSADLDLVAQSSFAAKRGTTILGYGEQMSPMLDTLCAGGYLSLMSLEGDIKPAKQVEFSQLSITDALGSVCKALIELSLTRPEILIQAQAVEDFGRLEPRKTIVSPITLSQGSTASMLQVLDTSPAKQARKDPQYQKLEDEIQPKVAWKKAKPVKEESSWGFWTIAATGIAAAALVGMAFARSSNKP